MAIRVRDSCVIRQCYLSSPLNYLLRYTANNVEIKIALNHMLRYVKLRRNVSSRYRHALLSVLCLPSLSSYMDIAVSAELNTMAFV